jgi:NIPSNAP
MITLCIRYTLDHNKLADFEAYARTWAAPVARHGGALVGYFLPTKLAGSTNTALALIGFPDLTAYERYRAGLMNDPEVVANVRRVEASGCILNEDRSFVQRVD